MSASDHQDGFIPYQPATYEAEEMLARSRAFYELMNTRRSVRVFSDRPVAREVIEHAIRAAGTAPSGAHKQPWSFCVVEDFELRKEIRKRAEQEEKQNYDSRMSDRWLKDLEPLGTNHIKPFITDAPYLIVMFKQAYGHDSEGNKQHHYYVNESVGIAAGMLITALHYAGLSALTHTPSPMNFLEELLDRPGNERAYLNIPVGYPSADARVPDLTRKAPEDFIHWY